MTTQTPTSARGSVEGGGPAPVPTTDERSPTGERAAEVGGTARQEAAGIAEEVRHQARDLIGETRSQVRQQIENQKGRLVGLLSEVGEDLDRMAQRGGGSTMANTLVVQLAQRTRDARDYVEGGDVIGDVRGFARRRPGTFLLGSMAAGALLGRATAGAVAARRQQQRPSPEPGPHVIPASPYEHAPGPTVPREPQPAATEPGARP
jgi:hypothetical protein